MTLHREIRNDYYDQLFAQSPETANVFLLLCDMANADGVVEGISDAELCAIVKKNEDLREYQL